MSVSTIKKAQKERNIQREVATLLMQAAQDHPELTGITVTRAEITAGKGMCYVYMYVEGSYLSLLYASHWLTR